MNHFESVSMVTRNRVVEAAHVVVDIEKCSVRSTFKRSHQNTLPSVSLLMDFRILISLRFAGYEIHKTELLPLGYITANGVTISLHHTGF